MNNATDIERFFAPVTITESCWSRGNGRHYSRMYDREQKRTIAAHRYAYALAYGPIPDGLHVLHRCDNRGCVRPSHLFLGTPRDNMQDMIAKGRGAWQQKDYATGSRHGLSKLTEEAVLDIRKRWQRGRNPNWTKRLAAEYNVHPTLIWQVVRRKIWTHI